MMLANTASKKLWVHSSTMLVLSTTNSLLLSVPLPPGKPKLLLPLNKLFTFYWTMLPPTQMMA